MNLRDLVNVLIDDNALPTVFTARDVRRATRYQASMANIRRVVRSMVVDGDLVIASVDLDNHGQWLLRAA